MNFPAFEMNLTEREGRIYVKDFIRNKNIRLTPEEWVRQHLLHYLVQGLKYPKGLIKVETNVNINRLKQRTDIVVYNSSGEVFMVAECKRPEINVERDTLFQAVRYNAKLGAKYVLITNGNEHHCFNVDKKRNEIEVMEHFPTFE